MTTDKGVTSYSIPHCKDNLSAYLILSNAEELPMEWWSSCRSLPGASTSIRHSQSNEIASDMCSAAGRRGFQAQGRIGPLLQLRSQSTCCRWTCSTASRRTHLRKRGVIPPFKYLALTTLHARLVTAIVASCLEGVLRDWCLSAGHRVAHLHRSWTSSSASERSCSSAHFASRITGARAKDVVTRGMDAR